MKNKALPILFAVFSAFPTLLFGQDNEKLIKDYISQNKIREYKKSDLNNIIIDNVDPSKSMNGDVVRFLQTYNGLPIYSSSGTALIRDGKIIYYVDNFVKDYTTSTSGTAIVNKKAALQKIAEDLKNSDIAGFTILGYNEKNGQQATSANQRLVYVKDEKGNLRLAYEYNLTEPKSPNYWNILVDASNGNILEKNNLTLSCSFHPNAYASDIDHNHTDHLEKAFIGPENMIAKNNAALLAPDNATYNVFPLPIESATFGSRSLVSNPWILAASPEGWHSDGTTHYNITRGNNVFAYEDVAGNAMSASNNLPGTPADGGASRNFDFPFGMYSTAAANRNASITNLFYLNNKAHDIFYKFGFTETARNFQQNNFGSGPVGGDDDMVYAEAQDGGGTNNANFSSPGDGYNPKMQMYLWSTTNTRLLFYNTPGAASSRAPIVGSAQFGPALNATGVTGEVKLSPDLQACQALPAGALTGKIGLIERGGGANCGFAVKVKNAQNAGAIGVIVYSNAGGSSIPAVMGGVDGSITIPSVVVQNAEGEYIKSQLASNTIVNVTLKKDAAYNVVPDGSFDNGVVIHEYGHGISNRLTATGAGCLNTNASKEQMGEGWSDFFALMLTNKAGDNASVPRAMGTYVSGQSNEGAGIRPARYSPDFAVNPFTYGSTNTMQYTNTSGALVPDVHSIGFVWATMLWDLHWKYVEKYGYSSDVLANTTNGSTKVLQLIMDGLKLQVCNPSFIEGRDAILKAELATTQGADKCMIWNVFAKRGLGLNANAGVKSNITDQVENFDVPEECLLATNEVKTVKESRISIYPNPARDEFYINFPSNTLGKVNVELYDMSGKMVSSEDKISPDAKKAISTANLINGTYIVKIKGLGFESSSKVIVRK
ncbi:T9SS-dependent M36 family metallopeptidase [Chryseobacterium lactis]|uniref:T9SS-dependent M36 family metallopeptidase n=1 Tax=Chryseobacterium lactis TaxID=1241981 RepID=UPI0021AB3F11|nr:T9SS-dependent M36 family metallopeptidase [Chryseobacterium lactis]